MAMRRVVITASILMATAASVDAQGRSATCTLQHVRLDDFVGLCDWPRPGVAAALTWHPDRGVWAGTLAPRVPEDPPVFEVLESHDDKPGIAKTPYGWFPLIKATRTDNVFTVIFSADAEVAPSVTDLRILRRALEMLTTAEDWNSKEDRTCPSAAARWSLYCVVTRAINETVGEFHYRQPAMQVVRIIVGEVGADRIATHRLMDFNNHRETTFRDIQNVLRLAAERVEVQLRETRTK